MVSSQSEWSSKFHSKFIMSLEKTKKINSKKSIKMFEASRKINAENLRLNLWNGFSLIDSLIVLGGV